MPIHPHAYIDKTAQIAASADIAPNAFVGKNCIIHENVKIGYNAVVECNTEIKQGTVLSPNAHVGGAPQDIGYKGEDTKLIIGKDCVIREFAALHRATTKADWITEIGDRCYIMGTSIVSHDCKLGNDVIIVSGAFLAGHVEVGDFGFISAYSGIHQFVRIGTQAMVAGMTHVSLDVPPYCTIISPDKGKLVGLNVVGLKRRGVELKVRTELNKALRIFLDKSMLLEEAKEKLKELEQYPEIITFREFLNSSKRGITRV